MGDGADMALDFAMSSWEEAMDHEFSSLQERYDRGLCDENGFSQYPGVPIVGTGIRTARYYRKSVKASGPGACPKCGGETEVKKGQYGKFYGCKAFPFCKGSRNV